MKEFVLTGPPDEGFRIDGPIGSNLGPFFPRRVEPPKLYLSKEELANCPDLFQEGLMHRNEKAYYCWTTMFHYSEKSGGRIPGSDGLGRLWDDVVPQLK